MDNSSHLRVLVVEDEPLFAAQLKVALTELTYEVIGPAPNATTALALFHAASPLPDLALLDINLGPRSSDGITLAQHLLAGRPMPLIFLTSQGDAESFARAKALGPAAYLIKPVDVASLQRAIELAMAGFTRGHQPPADSPGQAAGETLPFNLPDTGVLLPGALFMKEEGLLVRVNLADISWIMAEDKFCRIALQAGRTVLVRQPLRDISQHLPAEQFVQIQRSYFVNASCIERLDPVRNLVQVAGQLLPMGKAYRDDLLERLRLV